MAQTVKDSGKVYKGKVFLEEVINKSKTILGSVALRDEIARVMNPKPLAAIVSRYLYKLSTRLCNGKFKLGDNFLEFEYRGETVIFSKSFRQKGAIEITFHAGTDDFAGRLVKPVKGKDGEAFLGLMEYVMNEMDRYIKINKLRSESTTFLSHMSRTNYYDVFEEVLDKKRLEITLKRS